MQVVNVDISDTQMSQLIDCVRDHLGLHFTKDNWRSLERGVISASQELGFDDSKECVEWLISTSLTKKQEEILAGHLTIGETYFFREKKSFDALEGQILPGLISSRQGGEKSLRIWSTACATGEEPYSIAIMLSKMVPNLEEWNISILATDINPRFLQKASLGVYRDWSFRGTPPEFRKRYFTETKEGHYQVHSYIKDMVDFSYLNLVKDVYPSLMNNTNAIDIIFCRNVLIYFDSDLVKNIVAHLCNSLIDGGWLIVSPVEASHVRHNQFVQVNYPDTIFYRKDAYKSQTVEDFDVEKISNYLSELKTDVTFQVPVEFTDGPLQEAVSADVFNDIGIQQREIENEILNEDIETSDINVTDSNLFEEAMALYERGRYLEVEEKLSGQGVNSQHKHEAVILLARAYANQGKLTEALECCKRAIGINKLEPGYYYLCATVLDEQGQSAEAIKSLKKALFLDHDFILAHFAMGNLHRKQGTSKDSRKHYDNALQLLGGCQLDDILDESEGITAGRLSDIIKSTIA